MVTARVRQDKISSTTENVMDVRKIKLSVQTTSILPTRSVKIASVILEELWTTAVICTPGIAYVMLMCTAATAMNASKVTMVSHRTGNVSPAPATPSTR